MGFLSRLIRRWSGTKTGEAPPAPPARPEPPAPVAPNPEAAQAPEAPAAAPPDPPPPAAPAPLGLPDDLQAPLRGDWGAVDVGSEPAAPPEPPTPAERQSHRQDAADRRRERAAAVAARHASDIHYLGRGVSEGLNDRRGGRARQEALGLPVMDTPAELADRLGITVPRLRWLAFHAEVAGRVHYVGFEVAKRGGRGRGG